MLNSTDTSDNALHHILIVDDEEAVLVSLRETLRREGYQVTAVPNAVEALTRLKEQVFSVVISDQQMPMLTGLEFLAQVKQLQPDCTRILITAVLSLATVIDAINKGEIYRFIVKPWLREELLVTVRNAAQRYEMICRNQMLHATTLQMNEKLGQMNKELEARLETIAVQNVELARLNSAQAANLAQSVELCLKTMQTFYPSLGAQARRVFGLCRAMGESLQLSVAEQQTLEVAAWLHDIGLVGVPRQLIKKWEDAPDSITEEERAVVQQHPVLGEELASFGHPINGAGAIIRAHHERFDGTGYPDGRKGEDIPWLARLLAVAVAYSESQADSFATVDRIKQGRGTVFDPEAVRVFLRCLPQVTLPRGQREVLLAELQPGMVLARGIYTSSGMLLLPDGQRLTPTAIARLNNHNRVNPIAQSLLVQL